MASNRLRILMVAARYLPYMGGTETHIYEVGRRFASAGHEVTILTSDPSGQLPKRERIEGMQIIRVKAWPASLDLYFAPGVYRVIMGGSWDVIHCQGYHTFVAPTGMLAALRKRIPYLVTFHSGGHSSRLRNLLRRPQWMALRPLLVRATQLIGVSRFEAEFFSSTLGIPRERFIIVPNGAELPKVDPKTPINTAGKMILSIGRLERYKRHQAVIEAFPLVLKKYPDMVLRILGSGPYKEELERLVERLGLTGRVEIGGIPPAERQQMANVISGAALVTLLSEYEAHPVAVMEALALGRPVLVTDTSGFIELAEQGLVRAISLHSSKEEVAAAMLDMINHPVPPAQVRLPTWDACAQSLLDAYMAVVNSPK